MMCYVGVFCRGGKPRNCCFYGVRMVVVPIVVCICMRHKKTPRGVEKIFDCRKIHRVCLNVVCVASSYVVLQLYTVESS